MLRELALYLTTPCRPVYRRMGYLRELIAIDSKHHRLHRHWQEHLEQCHRQILIAAQACQSHRKVIILGAGLLYDLPLAALAARFEEVVLVDVLFLRKTRRQVATWANVTLLEADVTGCIDIAGHLKPGERNDQPDPVNAIVPAYDPRTDLVVSLNLFSQLAVIPCHWFTHQLKRAEHTCRDWGRRVMQQHLQLLSGLHCQVLLIGDIRHEYRDRTGQLIEEDDFNRLLQLPLPATGWSWPISPPGELNRQLMMVSQVGAWHNWQVSGYADMTRQARQ